MTITATELKYNLGMYLKLSDTEDVLIKKNGKIIAMMTNPNKDRFDVLNSLKGIIPSDVDEDNIKMNRLLNK